MTVTVASFANCHSHAFHRALRGRGDGSPDFWSWRDGMYAVANKLHPENYYRLARATFAEMRLAGYTSVGEFHYLHHGPGGKPYSDPNAMAEAVIEAAKDVGLRICLLHTYYARAGFSDTELDTVQQRFVDTDRETWQQRATDLSVRYTGDDQVVVGTAIHSVRAVPADAFGDVARTLPAAPLHIHVSEQPAENAACLSATGLTPVGLLAEADVWSPRTTAVHATHLTNDDITILGEARVNACFCPSTEAELADGIGPSVALRTAGARITLGSDSNTVIDPFHEARSLAMHERLATGHRDGWDSAAVWRAATVDGHTSLGFEQPAPVDVAESVQTAGAPEVLWAATAANVVPPADLDPQDVTERLTRVINELWRV